MKPISKLSLLALFIFNGLLLQQCRKDENSCGECYINYKILGFRLNYIQKMDNNRWVFLSPDSIRMNTGDSIYLKMYDSSIRISAVQRLNESTLMACTPCGLTFHSDWDSLTVHTLQDFDSSYKAGSMVNESFLITDYPNSQFFPINDYRQFAKLAYHHDNISFSLVLIQKPKYSSAQFKFTFYASKTGDSSITISPLLKFK